VVLRYFEGLSSREIAGVLECSEETARNTLLRSLRKLRIVLSGSTETLS
jgi:DNA-directed RNA polymerase specialized sigma24 family protein